MERTPGRGWTWCWSQAPTPGAAEWNWEAPTESQPHTSVEFKLRRFCLTTDVGVNADVTYVTGGSEIAKRHERQFVLKYRTDPNRDRNVSIPKNVKKGKTKNKKSWETMKVFLLLLNGNVVLNIFLSDILSSECSSYRAQFEPDWWVSPTSRGANFHQQSDADAS